MIKKSLLKDKVFIAYWGATTFFRLGSNILQFALAIYVLDLTGSAFVFSSILAIIILPRIIGMPISGHLADFKNSLKILKFGAISFVILIATFFSIHIFMIPLNIISIYVLVILLESVETLISASESKAIIYLVKEEQISEVSKISSLDDGIVEIISPVIASFSYGLVGLGGVLIVILFLEIVAFFLILVLHPRYNHSAKLSRDNNFFNLKEIIKGYKELFKYLYNNKYLIGIILFAPLFNFFMNPIFSVTTLSYFRIKLRLNIEIIALFNSVLGVASLIAPFIAMKFINDKNEYKSNLQGSILSVIVLLISSIILFSICGKTSINALLYIVAIVMMLLVIIITIMGIATSITIKKRVPEEVMGRIVAIIQLSAVIVIPVGQLLYGYFIYRFPLYISFLVSTIGLAITYGIMRKTYNSMEIV